VEEDMIIGWRCRDCVKHTGHMTVVQHIGECREDIKEPKNPLALIMILGMHETMQ
jgi:hypothetical protein